MPDNKYKKIWDLLIVYHLLYTAFLVPYQVVFVNETSDFSFIYSIWMDGCFLIDIVLTFFTALLEDHQMITDHKSIASHYLTGWFFIDFFTSLPT